MIVFAPESEDRLRSRYAEAIRPVFDPESMALGVQERPGETRRNVFDFEDGLRLIISRDAIPRPTLHLSASIYPNTAAYQLLAHQVWRYGLAKAMDAFRGEAEARFRAVSGETRPLVYLGIFSDKGVPHWVIEDA
jgi:hypothetical protein